VVRTITVPAIAALIGRANWWPAKPRKAATGCKAVDAHARVADVMI
jgi:RND superfamily putative drug exporter